MEVVVIFRRTAHNAKKSVTHEYPIPCWKIVLLALIFGFGVVCICVVYSFAWVACRIQEGLEVYKKKVRQLP